MGLFFGLNSAKVCKDSPYRIFQGLLCTESPVPLSDRKEWVSFPKVLLEGLVMTTELSLSHRGVEVKKLATFCEWVFGDSIREDDEIQRLLRGYHIDKSASLSLDVSVRFARKHYLLNPRFSSQSPDEPPFLLFSSFPAQGCIADPYYLVPADDPLRTSCYFSVAHRNTNDFTDDERRVLDVGPGERLGCCEESEAHLLWRSSEHKPYLRSELQEAAQNLVSTLYPQFSRYPSADPAELIAQYKMIEQEHH